MKNKFTKLEKSWIFYDVGNSAFVLIISTIIPIFFKNLASSDGVALSDSTAYWSYTLSFATLVVGILGPTLGRLADGKDKKKKYFTFFLIMGVIGCALLGFIQTWQLFLFIFLIGRIGFSGSLVFYDAMLVDVTTDENSDEVSSAGYAWGYIGSVVPFVVCLLIIMNSDKLGLSGSMVGIISFSIIAIWWFVCTI
ncbi:MAG: MFS transporter, partial [Erysipelotrichaceae bacterium]